MKKILLVAAFAVTQIAWVQPVAAQTKAGEAASGESHELDEIVVTAERRRTNLQTTSIAATVMTGEKVAASGVTIVDQLQFISPSATVNNFGQGIDFNIRGIGKAEHNTQTTTGVITYRDGVATFPGYFTAEPYYDIASVEILRGPQGTFVGQNATGGAVFVTSQDPIINGGHTGYLQAGVVSGPGPSAILEHQLDAITDDEAVARASGDPADVRSEPTTGGDGRNSGLQRQRPPQSQRGYSLGLVQTWPEPTPSKEMR